MFVSWLWPRRWRWSSEHSRVPRARRSISKKQKAAISKQLRKQIKKNPRVIRSKSFLRKAGLVDFRLPVTIRIRGDCPAGVGGAGLVSGWSCEHGAQRDAASTRSTSTSGHRLVSVRSRSRDRWLQRSPSRTPTTVVRWATSASRSCRRARRRSRRTRFRCCGTRTSTRCPRAWTRTSPRPRSPRARRTPLH